MMLVIGLTGSIGMGKSAAAAHFARRGVPVFDADAEVHRLYAGEAVAAIEAAFPGVTRKGKVDREALARQVAGAPEQLARLEAIVHPLVVKAEIDFLREQEAKGARLAVLEIPLLFETDAKTRVDVTLVVSAPEAIQKRRVLARPAMTEEKLGGLLARQLPDAEKRKRADFVVDTGTTLAHMQAEIDTLIESLMGRKGRVMERLRHEPSG
jgi:dephospho-CoA kinase